MEYKKLSAIPPAPGFTTAAKILVIDNGQERLVPVTALVTIDRAITSKAALDALAPDSAVGDTRWFINQARQTLECHEYRADGWHQIL